MMESRNPIRKMFLDSQGFDTTRISVKTATDLPPVATKSESELHTTPLELSTPRGKQHSNN